MIQGSGRWAVVGIRSATNAAVSPRSEQHGLVEGHVARRQPDRDPGSISASPSTRRQRSAAATGSKLGGR